MVPFTGFIVHGLPILEKYNYTLPVISNQKFNEYVKGIGEIAVLNNPVRIIRFKTSFSIAGRGIVAVGTFIEGVAPLGYLA